MCLSFPLFYTLAYARGASSSSYQSREYEVKAVPFLGKIEPKLMKYSDIPRATRTSMISVAAANDPLERYLGLLPTHKQPKWKAKVWENLTYVMFVDYVRGEKLWTVEEGYSMVLWIPAPSTQSPPTYIDKLIDTLIWRATAIAGALLNNAEQKKRGAEYKRKLTEGIKRYLGDRLVDMLQVESLATSPERQGRGYASALVRLITNAADEQGRATWLASSNVAANTGFYNSLGFITVGTVLLGEDNPTWTEPPVAIAIMIREFKEKN